MTETGFVARDDAEIRAATRAISAVYPYGRDIRAAATWLRKHRGRLAFVGQRLGVEELRVLCAIQSVAIVRHVDEGTPIDHVSVSDDDLYAIVTGIVGGGVRSGQSLRVERAIIAAAFLIDPTEVAASLSRLVDRREGGCHAGA